METLQNAEQVADLFLHTRKAYAEADGEMTDEQIDEVFAHAGISRGAAREWLSRYSGQVVDATVQSDEGVAACDACGAPDPQTVEVMVATAFFHGFLTRTGIEMGYEPTEHVPSENNGDSQ